MARVLGYTRVSTDEQAAEGVSLKAQEARIEEFCTAGDFDLEMVYIDAGRSADSLDRPGLDDLRRRLAADEIDGIVVAKLDRLTRRLRDWCELLAAHFSRAAGRRIWTPSGPLDTWTAAGRLVIAIQVAVSEWELDTIVERTVEARDFKRSKGERLGTVPYGWDLGRDGKTLERNEREQGRIAWMRQLRSEGYSFAGIATVFDDGLIPSKSGKRWHASTVRQILERTIDERV